MADLYEIAGRIHSTSQEHVAAPANEIIDETNYPGGKKQDIINKETHDALEDRYTKAETYSKSELNQMVAPQHDYITVATFADLANISEHPVGCVYRVSNYDGTNSQVDATKYSEYSWDGSDYIHLATKSQIGEVFDVSEYNATGGVLATYASLDALLSDDNLNTIIPEGVRHGGMIITFVQGTAQSSDNKYVQWRYMGTDVTGSPNPFLNTDNWQGVDNEPTANSENLVKSGYFCKEFSKDGLISYPCDKLGSVDLSGNMDYSSPVLQNTGLIDVSEYDYLKYKSNISSSYYLLAFYDAQKTFLPNDSIVGTGAAVTEKTVDIPSTARYVIGSFYFGEKKLTGHLKMSSLGMTVDALMNKDKYLVPDGEIEDLYSLLVEEDYYIKYETGEPSTRGIGGHCTGFIYIGGRNKIKLNVSMVSPGAGIAYFDENKNYLKDISISTISAGDRIFDVLESASYVIISTYGTLIGRYALLYTDKTMSLQRASAFKDYAFSAFRKFGVVGDSLSVGMVTTTSGSIPENIGRDIYNSWGQFLARKYGNVCLNFGFSGATCGTWLSSSEGLSKLVIEENKCQCYIIGLGVNGESLGSIDDIDWEDMDNNANTFYGNYAKILRKIEEFAPSALLFPLTIPYQANMLNSSRENVNEAIRTISTHFDNAYLIDLEKDYLREFITLKPWTNGDVHYNAIGYSLCGSIIANAISNVIMNNADKANLRRLNIIPYGSNDISS